MNDTEQRASSPTQPSSEKDHDNCTEGSDEYHIVDPSPESSSDPAAPISCYFKRMNQDNEYDTVNYPIPEQCVGLVIGKGGSEVNSIYEKTGCRLQVHTEPSSPGFRMVEIHGPRNKIDMAKDCISQVVCRLNRPPPNSHSYGKSHNNFRSDRDPPKTIIVMSIPPKKVGSLIGKGGDTLRKLRNITNCNIQLIQENAAPNAARPLKITGDPHCVDHAQRVVSEFLAGNENFLSVGHPGYDNGMGMIMTLHVKVPRSSVGAIMGEHGQTVKDLSEKTGSKIHVLPDEDHQSMERMLALVGTRYQVHLAAAFIKDIIDATVNGVNESAAVFYLNVPASRCGLVIGKGGETIKQINAETGAHCEVHRDGQPNPNIKTFVLRGTELQVEHAKHLISMKVGDIAPNTPFVPNIPQSQLLLQPRYPMQMQAHQQLQQQLAMQSPMSPQLQAQIQARLQAQFQAQMHGQQQMQARSPQQNTLTNVQMWTGQPIIQNQNPNHPQTQLLQQQIQQRQAQQQQLQQQQLQHQHFQQLQQQHLQQQRLLQQQSMAGHFNQPNYQGQYQQSNAPGWQRMLSQQSNQSGMQSGTRSQQFSPQQHMQNNQNYQPYEPQKQQLRFSPQQSQDLSPSPPSNPAQPTYDEPLTYGQNFTKISKPMENETEKAAEPDKKEDEQQESDTAEVTPDYSEEWYQYYVSIEDHKNAENVRRRIEEIKAEKAKKAAEEAASSSNPRR